MPLYEILCVAAHYPEIAPIRELLRTTSNMVVSNGGVVRNIDYWGTRTLPHRMKRHQQHHEVGDFVHLTLLTSPPVLSSIHELLRVDPRVVRWQTLKTGEKLDDVVKGLSKGVALQQGEERWRELRELGRGRF